MTLHRDHRGRFAKRYRKSTTWDKLMVGVIFLIPLIGAAAENAKVEYEKELEVEQVAEPVDERKEIRIEVYIDWTPERVIEEIEKTFPNAPIMVEVARCESNFIPDAFNPTNNSNDQGIFQISEMYHKKHYEKLGLDMMDVQDNIAYAKRLYNEQGLAPWVWSKHCWSK